MTAAPSFPDLTFFDLKCLADRGQETLMFFNRVPSRPAQFQFVAPRGRVVNLPRKSAVAWVHEPCDLQRACDDLSALFEFRQLNSPDLEVPPLLGIWVGGERGRLDAQALEGLGAGAGRVLLSAGVCGVWKLGWLEGYSRVSLLESLTDLARADRARASEARFVPVFPSDASPFEVSAELERLRSIYGPTLGEPMIQDVTTRRLSFAGDQLNRILIALEARRVGREQLNALA